jgi:hypothetical protein
VPPAPFGLFAGGAPLGADMGGAAVDGTEGVALRRWAGGCDATGGRCWPGNASGWRLWTDCAGVLAPLVEGPLTDGCGEAVGRVPFVAPPCLMGSCRLVERLRISLPCTTMLSFDFLRSRVSISAYCQCCTSCRSLGPTITTRVQVDYRPYADIYNTEKALVLLLELLLVKDLNRENALLVDSPARVLASVRL